MQRAKYRMKRHEVTQPQDPSYRIIPLTKGQNALVDTEDFEYLSQWNWTAHWAPNTKSFYAVGRHDSQWPKMHHGVMRCKKEFDHKNHNTLDNRKDNLRECKDSQNKMNKRKYKNNTSGYKGVHKFEGKWTAAINSGNKRAYLGRFNSPEEAAMAYDSAAKIYHGKFANLNFP